MQQAPPTHRVTLIVEVDEPTDLSPADLVAMADMLREAATELAPHGTTRACVELGVLDDPASSRHHPQLRSASHSGQDELLQPSSNRGAECRNGVPS